MRRWPPPSILTKRKLRPPLSPGRRDATLVKRMDPVAVQARKGGRPAADAYLLRGLAFCAWCDEPLYTRSLAAGRHYVCAAVRDARGTCDAPKIPAELVERAVIEHLHGFIGDVEAWVAEKAREADSVRARFIEGVDAQRTMLRKLEVRAERAREQYERLLDAGDDLAADALREAVRINADAENARDAIEQAEQRLADWPTAPQVDAALDFYTRLRDAIAGHIDAASTVAEMNAALRTVLERAKLGIGTSGQLHGQFWLRDTGAGLPYRLGLLGPLWEDAAADGMRFYPAYRTQQELERHVARRDAQRPGADIDLVWVTRLDSNAQPVGAVAWLDTELQTGPQTFVYVQPAYRYPGWRPRGWRASPALRRRVSGVSRS
jgi:hypothetical protein